MTTQSDRKQLVVGAGHAHDLSHVAAHSRARPAPTTKEPPGKQLEEVKKGIGETWAGYPVLGATRGGLAAAKTIGAGRARDLSHVAAHSRAWPAPTTREPPGKQPQRYKPVFCGTVFYNPMRILIGSIAFVYDDDEPGITSPDYVALQGKAGLVDSRWFYYWLRSPYGVQCINSLARGAVRERMLFNRLAEGSIRLPPYQEQLRVSKALATVKPVKYAIQGQLNDLNKIPERLLAQAFEQK
jgi:type I restriction enzyme S subunit